MKKPFRFIIFCISIIAAVTYLVSTMADSSKEGPQAPNKLIQYQGEIKTGNSEAGTYNELAINAESAIVTDIKGNVLYTKNPDKKMYPASTTKVLTALLALENYKLEDVITVGDEANRAGINSSKAGLEYGEKITMANLLKGLLLPSGNDAAYVIAVNVSRKVSGNPQMNIDGAVKYFCSMMNQRARKAGAKNSNFINPDGYHNSEHFTTAKDLSLITRETLKYPYFCEVVNTPVYSMKHNSAFNKKDKSSVRTWINTDKLILENDSHFYKYATGVKTGHTSEAGYCLVSSAQKGGKKVIAVEMKSTEQDQWDDAIKLLEYGLEK